MTHTFRELDAVVLVRDFPEAGLRAGDLGAIVLVHTTNTFEVEFATVSGHARAVVTLGADDLRPAREDDLLTVRSTTPASGAT